MCDYTADGVWNRKGQSCDADELPVETDIVTMIRGWQAWYEHADYSAMTPWFDATAHAAYGLFIARLVKRTLPDWTVIYFDESKIVRSRCYEQPRSDFEYEITLHSDGTFSP